MKKIALALTAAVLGLLLTSQAFAWGPGPGRGNGQGHPQVRLVLLLGTGFKGWKSHSRKIACKVAGNRSNAAKIAIEPLGVSCRGIKPYGICGQR